MRISRPVPKQQYLSFAGISRDSTRLSTAVDSFAGRCSLCPLSTPFVPRAACGQPAAEKVRLYSPAAGTRWPGLLFGRDETDLSAERAEAEAEAWLPRPNGDACGSADPQAAPLEGPQAPVGVMPPVQRRNRLSRSRDFDAVYRQGRSVSTRFLTLYWFQRDESIGAPRLGFAVPKAVGNAVVRNRIKRQLRDIVRDRLQAVPVSNDYVLVVRQGLPEAAEANGHDWLTARVDEVLGKAAA